MIQNQPDVCPECNHELTQKPAPDEPSYCRVCGYVVEEEEQPTSTPQYGAHKQRDTTGPLLQPKTTYQPELANIDPTESSRQKLFRRLAKLNKRTRANDEYTRVIGHIEIERIASTEGLDEPITTTAKQLYQEALNHDVHIGRSLEATADASFVLSTRIHNYPITYETVANRSQVTRPSIQRASKALQQHTPIPVSPPTADAFVSRILNNISTDIPPPIKNQITTLCTEAVNIGLQSGREPKTLAAGAIYLITSQSSHITLTQEQIADAANVSVVSLREHYYRLQNTENLSVQDSTANSSSADSC